jgi:hypothetical protein
MDFQWMDPLILVISTVTIIGSILFLPVKGAGSFKYTQPPGRFYEAGAVLSGPLLIPGSDACNS